MFITSMVFLSPKIRIPAISRFDFGSVKILWSMPLLTKIATPPP